MATIESYETSGGKRYQVRYRTPERTQTKKRGFRTKREAEQFAASVESQGGMQVIRVGGMCVGNGWRVESRKLHTPEFDGAHLEHD